jgi:hypothetical protein
MRDFFSSFSSPFAESPSGGQRARSIHLCGGAVSITLLSLMVQYMYILYILYFFYMCFSLSNTENCTYKVSQTSLKSLKDGIFYFSYCIRYSTLLHLAPLRFHRVGGCWDRSQDSCYYGIG